MGLANQTTTVQYIIDQCRLHTKLQNFFNVGGVNGEPGLSICTRVNQKLLTRRMPWKFNVGLLAGQPQDSGGMFMVCQQGMQDIKFAGATAFVLLNSTQGAAALPAGGVSIDLAPSITFQEGFAKLTFGPVSPLNNQAGGVVGANNQITVQTIDPHPFQTGNIGQSTVYLTGIANPIFNSTLTWNQLTQTCQWTGGYPLAAIPDIYHLVLTATNPSQTNGVTSGAPGIFNFGWLQSAALVDINSTAWPQPTQPIRAVHRLAPEYTTRGEEMSICMLIDYNNGVLKFRLSEPTSTYAFQFNCTYQLRSPKFNSPQQVIQWPDDYVFAFQELALWEAMRFAYGISAEEATAQMQVALLALQNVMESEDREDNTQALTPDYTLMEG